MDTSIKAVGLLRRSWLYLGACATVASLAVITTGARFVYHDSSVDNGAFGPVLAVHSAYWVIWAIICAGAYVAADVLTRRSWRAGLFAYLALAATAVVAHLIFFSATRGLESPGEDGRSHLYWYASSNTALFALVVLAASAIQNYRYRQAREAERQAALLENQRLATALADSRLAALRAQIHPHLIFNALNCVAALIEEGRREEANRAMSQLGDLLRFTLTALESTTISLSEEFTLVVRMFEIGRLRFGERFTWETQLPDSLAEVRVAPFLLQPLAENALLHAVGKSSAPAHISVCASRSIGGLRLEVEDSCADARAPVEIVPGLGLRNLAERARLLGGSCSLTPRPGGVHARVELPEDAIVRAP